MVVSCESFELGDEIGYCGFLSREMVMKQGKEGSCGEARLYNVNP